MYVGHTHSFSFKLCPVGNLGGIGLSINADRMRNKFQNVDMFDGIMVNNISLLGALVVWGHLKVMSFIMATKQVVLHFLGFGTILSRGEGNSPNLVARFII
jgi:hypothetical protein